MCGSSYFSLINWPWVMYLRAEDSPLYNYFGYWASNRTSPVAIKRFRHLLRLQSDEEMFKRKRNLLSSCYNKISNITTRNVKGNIKSTRELEASLRKWRAQINEGQSIHNCGRKHFDSCVPRAQKIY